MTRAADAAVRQVGPGSVRHVRGDAEPSHIAFSYVLLFNLPLTLPMRQSGLARSWRPRHSCYFTRRPPGLRGRATNRLLPPAEGLDRKPAIALTVINLGLLSSDAHGNSFTAGAGKSLSPAAFDAPSRQRSVRRVCESVRELLLAARARRAPLSDYRRQS